MKSEDSSARFRVWSLSSTKRKINCCTPSLYMNQTRVLHARSIRRTLRIASSSQSYANTTLLHQPIFPANFLTTAKRTKTTKSEQNTTTTTTTTTTSTAQAARWGLFGDIHFQDRGLDDIVRASDFIIDTFVQRQVSSVIALGDILNTRENVSVQALAQAFEFFERLGRAIPGKVHIILGNHDMHLKHRGRISSLDALSMTPMKDKFRLYRDMQITEIDGRPAVMLPYQEQQSNIRDWVEQHHGKYALHDMAAFGHLNVDGAIQRYQADNTGNVFLRKYFDSSKNEMNVDGSPAINPNMRIVRGAGRDDALDNSTKHRTLPSHLTAMKRVFTGHFHHHHALGENGKVVYCGAPLQHHFGDSGDFGRGVIVYDPDEDHFDFVQNPEWDMFRTVRVSSESDLQPLSQYKGKRVSVIYENLHLVPDKIHSILLANGAAEVKKHSISVRRVTTSVHGHSASRTGENAETAVDEHNDDRVDDLQNLEELVDQFVTMYHVADTSFAELLISLGKHIIRESSAKHNLNRSSSKTFDAKLKNLTIENFLGVQGVLHFDFESMDDGIWFLQGANGSGKSSLLEAISWCLFDSFLRTDMKAAFAVNDVVKKNCRVGLEFANGITIERFRKYSASKSDTDNISSTVPKKKGTGVRVFEHGVYQAHFEKGSTRDSQRVIEDELLGIDFDTFSKSIVLGDNVTNFISSDSKTRRETIEKLLGLDKFDYFLQETRDRKKQNGTERTTLSTKIDLSREEVQTQRTRLEQLSNATRETDNRLNSLTTESTAKLKEAMKSLTEKKQRVQQQLATLSQQWERHKTSILEAKFWETQQSQLQQHRKKRAELKSDLTNHIKHRESLLNRVHPNGKISNAASLNEFEKNLSDKLAHLESTVDDMNREKFELSVTKETNASEIQRLTSVLGEHQCQYCGQDIEENTYHKMQRMVREIQQEQSRIIIREQEITERLRVLKGEIQQCQSQRTLLVDVKSRMYHTDREIKRLQNDIASQGKFVEGLESKMVHQHTDHDQQRNQNQHQSHLHTEWKYTASYPEIEKRENEKLQQQEMMLMKQQYESDVERKLLDEKIRQKNQETMNLRKNIDSLEINIESLSKELNAAQRQHIALVFWEKAFDKKFKKIDSDLVKKKRSDQDQAEQRTNAKQKNVEERGMITMRSYLLDKSIEELNAIFREYMQFLANQQQHDVPIDSKSDNDMQDALRISFDADLSINEEYAKRSSGQRRRNHLCVFFGLFELVRQHSSFRSQFLMLDEIFDGLDRDGQLATVNLIQLLATRVEKIFIITHSPYMLNEYRTNHIMAEKSTKGTTYRIVSH